MRYFIFDGDATAQRFPLRRLFRQLRELARPRGSECEVYRARGYGERIRSLELQLDSLDVVLLPSDAMDTLTEGVDEWFYELDARLSGTDVRFGLHDSTAMFVDADRLTLDKVISSFSSCRAAP